MRMLPHNEPTGIQATNPVKGVIAFFGVAILLAYAYGMLSGLAAKQFTAADRGLLSAFGWIGLSLVACDMVRSRVSVDRVLRGVTYLAAVVAGIGIVQFIFGVDIASQIALPGLTPNGDLAAILDRSDFRRVAGTATHPIEYGVILAALFPIVLHYALNDKDRSAIVRWGMLGLVAFAIPLSISRSATLGLAVALLIMFISWSGWRRFVFLLVTPLVLVAMRAAVPGLLGTLKSLFTGWSNDPSIQGRTDDYAVIGQYISQSPVFGTGFGTFLPTEFVILDNQFLGMLVETGVLGLVALLGLFVVGFACARGVVLRAADQRTRELGVALSASIATLGLSFLTFDGLGFPIAAGLSFLLIGITGALWRLTDGGSQTMRLPRAVRKELASSRKA